jgi:low affinity Fe/Cu permease
MSAAKGGGHQDHRSGRSAESNVDQPPGGRRPRPLLSRIIDVVTDVLGHEFAFVLAVLVVAGWLVGLTHIGIADQNYQLLINTGTTIVTFIMVFAVQHTSNRDARALHVKLDELLRASRARTELIGVEDETNAQLDQRKQELLDERRRATDDAHGPRQQPGDGDG